ncbi:MAG: Lrp/AsnC ligand binding domain-containing protein [Thermoplasmatales archaeon]|nr:Lrp/AsnC ligand binding domain-containing protein [Thermoplasmatales archaeon]
MANSVSAYVLIKTDVGRTGDVLNDILRLRNISHATSVAGDYDIVVEVTGKTVEDISSMVLNEIHKIPNIRETKTLMGTKYVAK